jgi:hypothetical protein
MTREVLTKGDDYQDDDNTLAMKKAMTHVASS